MAFAGRGEILALSRLFRGLSIKKQCCNGVKSRQFHVAAPCLLQENKPVFLTRVDAIPTTNLMQHNQHTLLAGNGLSLQQCRFYAKAATPQKKKLSFDYSGDLVTQKPLDSQDRHVDFREFPQLESAAESTKRLCSVEFASGTEKKIHRKEEMKERILHLFGHGADREMHVAMLTVDIRNMIPHVLSVRKDKLNKARLVEKIQLRKKMLKKLRRTDYQRFLWLLQELRIRYVLPPDYYRRITRKYRRKQRVWEAASSLRQKKIEALKAQLEAEKADFLRHKEEVLRQLGEDAQRYGLDLGDFEQKLERKRMGKTFPRIYTWEEREQLEDGHPLKPK
ncbi:small ribosomal subunit protein uS15m-like [Babylonia areolata]|uniref:small ribosomal subunit protein uS15m-like n=1 Tax=Babylonia areolata TaxID=304850 RepID=UPI003FD4BE3E